MDRQTLRDRVHRFNALGPDGRLDNWTEGPKPRLSAEQMAEFAQIVEAGQDRETDGVVRWRRIDLKRVIAERFGVEFHEPYVGTLLKKIGFCRVSARAHHPATSNKRDARYSALEGQQFRGPIVGYRPSKRRCGFSRFI
jgi:transposase